METGSTIKVLYFAQVAELLGRREETWPLPAPLTLAQWLQEWEQRYPQLAPTSRLKFAINQEHAAAGSLVKAGDELAVFEPVTGG